MAATRSRLPGSTASGSRQVIHHAAVALMCRGQGETQASSAGGTMSHRAALSCLAPAVPCPAVTQDSERLIIICMEKWADLIRLLNSEESPEPKCSDLGRTGKMRGAGQVLLLRRASR